MRLILILIIGLISIAASPNNWNLNAPPKDGDEKSQYDFNYQMYNRFNQFQVVTSNPTPNSREHFGKTILYQATGSIYYFCVQTTSPTGSLWKCATLNTI